MNKKSLFLIGAGSLLALAGCGGGTPSSSGEGVSSLTPTSSTEAKTFSVSVTKNDDVGSLVWGEGAPTDLTKVKEGTVLSFLIDLTAAYSKGTNLVVNANAKALTATDSVYTLPALKENVVISFSADINVYAIAFSSSISDVAFVPIEGESALPSSVAHGADAAFKVVGQGEYSQLADLSVLANGKKLTATEGVYHLSNSTEDWAVTATSSANVYSLNFHFKDAQGADKTVVIKAAYGSSVNTPALNDYTYGGYSYHQKGWFDAEEGGNAVSDFSASANSVKDFYAHYTKLSEITLILEEGISLTTTDGNSYDNGNSFFVPSGESCSFYLSFDSAHSQKADLSVCLGTTALVADSQRAYTFTPTGNASLTVICSKNSYEVSVTGSHLDRFDFVGETTASHGVDYQFKVALKDAYKADMVYVYNGANELKADNQGYYTLNTTSAVSLTIDVVSISEDLFNAKRFGNYFLSSGASVVADTSVSSPSASIAISGLVVAQAKREGFTHMKFASHHEGASHNEMVLVSGDAASSWDQYYKVLTACTGDFDFRVVLGSTTTSDESKTQFNVMARTDNVVCSSGTMTLSGFHFYTSPTSSWTLSSPMVYIAFEPDLGSDNNLVLDTVAADGGYFNFPLDISTALSKCESGVRVYQKVVVDRASGIRVGTGLGYYYADVIFDYPSVTANANLESGAPFAGYYWQNLNINQVVPSWGGTYANTTPDYTAHPFGLGLSFGGVEYFGVMYVHAAWGYPLMSRTTLIPSGALS